MSNLLKAFSLVCKEDKKIIDSNEAVTLKLQQIRHAVTDNGSGFSMGLNPENVGKLLEEDSDEYKNTMARAAETADSIIAEANRKAKSIAEGAKNDAARVIANARTEAETIKTNAYNDGLASGKEDGKKSVSNELMRLQAEYQDKQRALETQYQDKLKQMEPELVDVMLDVFGSITRALSPDQKDMILALVERTLSGTEAGNNYIIKACREDAEFLRENRDSLISRANRDINIEIIEDMSMKKNECLIDTDLGIYDCSLDIQLENLVRAIRTLSCTMEN